jgi:hypothetical protein
MCKRKVNCFGYIGEGTASTRIAAMSVVMRA